MRVHKQRQKRTNNALAVIAWRLLQLTCVVLICVWISMTWKLFTRGNNRTRNSNIEKDGFLNDVNPALLSEKCQNEGHINNDESFGLPLTASWRKFPPSIKSGYEKLVEKILPCFASTSGYTTLNNHINCINPEAHIYPFEDLHITVATFRTKDTQSPSTNEVDRIEVDRIKQISKNLLQMASHRDEWPKPGSKLSIKPKAIKLGRKNAIILWEDTSGNLDKIRQCIRLEKERVERTQDLTNDLGLSLDIPTNIVHSTFLRLWTEYPLYPEKLIHTLNEEVSIDDMFGMEEFQVDTSSVKLIFEDTPCMHVDDDKDHVIWKAS